MASYSSIPLLSENAWLNQQNPFQPDAPVATPVSSNLLPASPSSGNLEQLLSVDSGLGDPASAASTLSIGSAPPPCLDLVRARPSGSTRLRPGSQRITPKNSAAAAQEARKINLKSKVAKKTKATKARRAVSLSQSNTEAMLSEPPEDPTEELMVAGLLDEGLDKLESGGAYIEELLNDLPEASGSQPLPPKNSSEPNISVDHTAFWKAKCMEFRKKWLDAEAGLAKYKATVDEALAIARCEYDSTKEELAREKTASQYLSQQLTRRVEEVDNLKSSLRNITESDQRQYQAMVQAQADLALAQEQAEKLRKDKIVNDALLSARSVKIQSLQNEVSTANTRILEQDAKLQEAIQKGNAAAQVAVKQVQKDSVSKDDEIRRLRKEIDGLKAQATASSASARADTIRVVDVPERQAAPLPQIVFGSDGEETRMPVEEEGRQKSAGQGNSMDIDARSEAEIGSAPEITDEEMGSSPPAHQSPASAYVRAPRFPEHLKKPIRGSQLGQSANQIPLSHIPQRNGSAPSTRKQTATTPPAAYRGGSGKKIAFQSSEDEEPEGGSTSAEEAEFAARLGAEKPRFNELIQQAVQAAIAGMGHQPARASSSRSQKSKAARRKGWAEKVGKEADDRWQTKLRDLVKAMAGTEGYKDFGAVQEAPLHAVAAFEEDINNPGPLASVPILFDFASEGWRTSRWTSVVLDELVRKAKLAQQDVTERLKRVSSDYLRLKGLLILERAQAHWSKYQPNITEFGRESADQRNKQVIAAEARDMATACCRTSRNKLFQRRMQTVSTMVEIKKARNAPDCAKWESLELITARLGVDGMSSDEPGVIEVPGGKISVFFVKEERWRAAQFTNYMDLIDGAEVELWQDSNEEEGFSKPSKRIARLRTGGKVSRRPAASDKPLSFYEKAWLDGKMERKPHWVRSELRPTDSDFNLPSVRVVAASASS